MRTTTRTRPPAPAAGEVAVARLLKVLADPTRLAILRTLARSDQTVGELAQALDVPRSRLGNHLACGLHCGLWTSEKQGRTVVYSLLDPGVVDLVDLAERVAGPRAAHLASCTRIGPDWT